MNDIYRIYLSALRAFVRGSAPEPVPQEQWAALMELARINSTLGILSHVYLNHPDLTPEQLRPVLRRQCLQEAAMYAARGNQMALLAAEFDRAGIDFILFKGFVLRNFYPVPELRTYGDVDLVIRREDRAKSDELMKRLGYEPRDTWEPAYSYQRGVEYYEVHTDVMEVDVSDKADYMAYFSRIWDHTCPSETLRLPHALEFTPEFHLLYLLTHIAKHISVSGAGIRMYLDIAFFLKRFELDWQWIAGELECLALSDFANVVFCAVEDWFGVECPLPRRSVPAEVMADFLEFTLSGGIYGYAGRDKGTVFLKQQDRSREEKVSRTRTLLHHAFPPVRSLENRYTYLQTKPWLLPAAWVHRLADSRTEWARFAGHTREILSADMDEVKKLKRLYRELGL